MAARWSAEEDRLLRRLYADQIPVVQIAARLGRTPDALVARRRSLRIASRRASAWTPREEAWLRAGTTARLSASVLAERLGRSTEQVRSRRRKLSGRRPPGRRYLAQEDEAIRVYLRAQGDLAALAVRLGRSPDALRLHARHLGLYSPASRRRWSDWEDALIRDGYTSALPCAEIARQLPDRTTASVTARAHKLALVTYARRWSSQDDQRLAHLTARGSTLEDVAQHLARTPEAIRRRARRLGTKPPSMGPAPRHARRWTEPEDELLRLHHAVNPARLAQLLGRSDAAVCRRLCALGLRASAQRSPHHPASQQNSPLIRAAQTSIEDELTRRTPRRRAAIIRPLVEREKGVGA